MSFEINKMSWHVCRICLSGDKKIYSVANTELLDIFEKVTGNKWNKVKRPCTLCYICFYQLEKCLKLREMSKQSEEIFSQFFAGGFEFTHETTCILNERKLHKFIVTPVQDYSVGVHVVNCDVTIKKEVENVNFEDSSIDIKHGSNNNIQEDCDMNHISKVPDKVNDKEPQNQSKGIQEAKNLDKNPNNRDFNNENIPIQNKAKKSKKPHCPKKDKNELKGDNNKVEIKAKRKICFTLKFNVSNSKNTLRTSKVANVSDSEESDKFKCKYCDKSYKVKYALEKHLRTHEEALYSCQYCSKTFLLKSVLKLHETTHKKIYPRKLHRRISDQGNDKSDREFKCELCNKSFFQLSHLQQHIRVHTGERPFCCETCGKSFKQKSTLAQHNRIHTGDKPYKCKACNKSFVQLSNLEQHKKKHHAKKF